MLGKLGLFRLGRQRLWDIYDNPVDDPCLLLPDPAVILLDLLGFPLISF